jgi:hypothetical protein
MDASSNRTRLHAALICAAAIPLLAAGSQALAKADEPEPASDQPTQSQPKPAQPQPTQPTRDPAMSNPGVDRMMLEQSRSRLNTDPIDPVPSPRAPRAVPSVVPPADLGGDRGAMGVGGAAGGSMSGPRPAAVTAEGAVTGLMPGRLYRASSGELIFAGAIGVKKGAGPDEPLVDERAFVLLPNQTLSQLSGATSNMGDGVPLVMSGQAFSYRGTSYLLPLTFSIRPEPEPEPVATEPAPSTPAQADTTRNAADGAAPAADPRVTDLITRLEQNRQPRALDAAMVGASAPAAPAAPATRPAGATEFTPSALGALAPEGTLVIRSRARLTRPGWAAGRLVVAFDNDPKSPSRAPMLMMPSRMLEQAEAMAGQLGEDATFLVSGRVTIHEGRNYFLPILVQRLPRGDVRPGQ